MKIKSEHSIYLSTLLRHQGIDKGLKFNEAGFTTVNSLLQVVQQKYQQFTLEILKSIVENDKKTRFMLSEQDTLIRANQGHSGAIADLIDPEKLLNKIQFPEEIPVCIHGTYKRHQNSILENGLSKMDRQFIHCAGGVFGTVKSGIRRDCDLLVYINTEKALKDGIDFYISANDVILTSGINGVLPKQYFLKIEEVQQ